MRSRSGGRVHRSGQPERLYPRHAGREIPHPADARDADLPQPAGRHRRCWCSGSTGSSATCAATSTSAISATASCCSAISRPRARSAPRCRWSRAGSTPTSARSASAGSSSQGMQVGEALTDFEGVLTGLPAYHGAVAMLKARPQGSSEAGADEDRVLILAPRGRDAAVIEQVLAKAGTTASPDLRRRRPRGCDDLADGAGCRIVTEEALVERRSPRRSTAGSSASRPGRISLHRARDAAVGPAAARRAAAMLERLGNVVLLERPINAETLISAVSSALRVAASAISGPRAHLAERERGAGAPAGRQRDARSGASGSGPGRSRRRARPWRSRSIAPGWDPGTSTCVSDRARRSAQHDAHLRLRRAAPVMGPGRFPRPCRIRRIATAVEAAFAAALRDRSARPRMPDRAGRRRACGGSRPRAGPSTAATARPSAWPASSWTRPISATPRRRCARRRRWRRSAS